MKCWTEFIQTENFLQQLIKRMNLHLVVSSLFSKKLIGSNLNPSISFHTLLGTRLHFFVVTWIPQLINMRRLKSWWLMILKTGCVTCILKLSSYLGKTHSSFAIHLVYYFWACFFLFSWHRERRSIVTLSGDRIVVHQRKPLSSLQGAFAGDVAVPGRACWQTISTPPCQQQFIKFP